MIVEATARFHETVQRVRRTTPAPLLVRVGLFVAAVAGQVLAWPLFVTTPPAAPSSAASVCTSIARLGLTVRA